MEGICKVCESEQYEATCAPSCRGKATSNSDDASVKTSWYRSMWPSTGRTEATRCRSSASVCALCASTELQAPLLATSLTSPSSMTSRTCLTCLTCLTSASASLAQPALAQPPLAHPVLAHHARALRWPSSAALEASSRRVSPEQVLMAEGLLLRWR